jgi:hypothetical protein
LAGETEENLEGLKRKSRAAPSSGGRARANKEVTEFLLENVGESDFVVGFYLCSQVILKVT